MEETCRSLASQQGWSNDIVTCCNLSWVSVINSGNEKDEAYWWLLITPFKRDISPQSTAHGVFTIWLNPCAEMRYPTIEQVLCTKFKVNVVGLRNFGGNYVHDATEFPESGLSKRRNLNQEKLRWQSVKDSCVSQTVANPIGGMDRSRCQPPPKVRAAMGCGVYQNPPEPIIRVRSLTTNHLHHTKVYIYLSTKHPKGRWCQRM